VTRRTIAVIVAAISTAGCGDTGGPVIRSPVTYTLTVFRCTNLCTVVDGTAPVTVANRGDSLLVTVTAADTVTGDSTLVTLSAPCAASASLVSGRTVVRTFPAAVSCPDSTVQQRLAAGPEQRAFPWVVDSVLSQGNYSLRGDLVVAPPLAATYPLHVN
jgi:hypothetical protein